MFYSTGPRLYQHTPRACTIKLFTVIIAIVIAIIIHNNRLIWKGVAVANTLAYCNTAAITATKSFIVQAPGSNPIKLLALLIYRDGRVF
jgi:hypothetical protein